MYCSYWGLEKKPFENLADPAFFFSATAHEAAFLKMRYAVESHRGSALLVGPSGVGKTFLIELMQTQLETSITPVTHIVFPQMNTEELLTYLADQLTGAEQPSGSTDVSCTVSRIQKFLVDNTRQGNHATVIIDEAHLLTDPQTWESLRLLLNFEVNGHSCITLLFVGQTGLLPMIDRMPHIEGRLGVKCLLRPLDEEETVRYMNHRMECAGATREIFEPSAITSLYEVTQGIPRQINRLADMALLIGYGEDMPMIPASALESMHRELLAVTG